MGRRTDLPPPTVYTEEYFLSGACEGLDEYLTGQISAVKRREFELLGVQRGERVLDLGCGRGEGSAEILRRGAFPVAVDYSESAVKLTHEHLDHSSAVLRADATRLPFAAASFDRVLFADVIEHLPWRLAVEALEEVERVLKPGGVALVHTSPNTWFIAVVMRPLRLVLKVLRRDEVLERFREYERLRFAMHPNELSPLTLPRLMRRAGVQATTWVDRDVMRSGASEWTEKLSQSAVVRRAARVAGLWPLRLVLGNDLYALVRSRSVPSGQAVRPAPASPDGRVSGAAPGARGPEPG